VDRFGTSVNLSEPDDLEEVHNACAEILSRYNAELSEDEK
jgi:hypothetical protein